MEKVKMKNKLRPIGTEFEVVFPPIVGSNDTKGCTVKYHVVGYEIVARFRGDKVGVRREVIVAIGVLRNEN